MNTDELPTLLKCNAMTMRVATQGTRAVHTHSKTTSLYGAHGLYILTTNHTQNTYNEQKNTHTHTQKKVQVLLPIGKATTKILAKTGSDCLVNETGFAAPVPTRCVPNNNTATRENLPKLYTHAAEIGPFNQQPPGALAD